MKHNVTVTALLEATVDAGKETDATRARESTSPEVSSERARSLVEC